MFQIASRMSHFLAFWFFTERSKADGEEPLELARFRRDCTCDGMTDIHCVKNVRIRSFFWSVFPHIRTEYGVNTERYGVSLRIQSKCGPEKLLIRTIFT